MQCSLAKIFAIHDIKSCHSFTIYLADLWCTQIDGKLFSLVLVFAICKQLLFICKSLFRLWRIKLLFFYFFFLLNCLGESLSVPCYSSVTMAWYHTDAERLTKFQIKCSLEQRVGSSWVMRTWYIMLVLPKCWDVYLKLKMHWRCLNHQQRKEEGKQQQQPNNNQKGFSCINERSWYPECLLLVKNFF